MEEKHPILWFLIILTLIFTVLKFINIIGWSFWWIFSPLWIPVFVGIVFVSVFIILGMLTL